MELIVNQAVVQPGVQKTVRYQLKFYFPEITDVIFAEDKVIIQSEEALPRTKVINTAEKMIQKFSRIQDNVPQKVLFQSETREIINYLQNTLKASNLETFYTSAKELCVRMASIANVNTNKYLHERQYHVRQGVNQYSELPIELMDALDDFFKTYFQREYEAVNLRPPSIIPASVVHRSGYFKTGCQHISFVSPITNDPDNFEEFLPHWNQSVDEQGLYKDHQLHHYTKTPRDVLNPAICLHCYPLFENQQIEEDITAVTMSGSVFRDESGNLNNEERLYEFKMREGIFIGSADRLKQTHPQLLSFMLLCGVMFDFTFELETSNDIFFDDNAMQQLLTQLVTDNKIELSVLSKQRDKHIAIASINKHQTHFTKSFNIKDGSQKASHTMCIAFGLNRFVLLLQEYIEQAGGVEAYVKKMTQNLELLKQISIENKDELHLNSVK